MLCSFATRIRALSLLIGMLTAITATPLWAASVGDPQIRTDHTYFPGELAMSTLQRSLDHAYSIPRGSVGSVTNRDKLIKVFLWRCETFTHLDSPQLIIMPGVTPSPKDGNTTIVDYDTLRAMFSYGWGLCGTNHAQMRAIAEAAGWQQRRRALQGDTGHEIGFGGLWRYVNTDQYTLHFLSNSASADFASLDQVVSNSHRYIEWNPDLGGGYFMPQANTHGSYQTFTGSQIPSIPLRSLQWRDYYANVWNIPAASSYKMYAEGYCAQPIVFRLKRGEKFTRWLSPDGAVNDLGLAGRVYWGYNRATSPHANWSFAQNAPARDQTVAGPEVTQAGGGMDYGNGCYDWQPSLANSEHLDGVASKTGTFVVGGSPVLAATTAGTMVFEVFTPYTICGRPTQNNASGWPDPALVCDSGAMLYTTHTGTITVDVSTDMGATWTSKGSLTDTLDFTEQVKARNGYLLRLNFSAGSGLNTFRLRTLTMLSQAVYPTLKNGTTTVTYEAGNQGALDLSPNWMNSTAAASTTGLTTLVADSGVTYAGYSGSFAYTQSINGGAYMIYKVTLPADLIAAGATFKQIFAAQDTQVGVPPNPGTTGTIEISTSQTGPWSSVADYAIPNDNELSHFWTYGRTSDATSLGGTTYYLRFFTNNAGRSSQAWRFLRINATYNLPASPVPMDVTYYWNNGANQTDTHTLPAGTVGPTSWNITTGTIAAQQKVVFSVPSGGVIAPTITTQPTNATVTEPATATFTVVASGTGLSYQWKRGGTPIGGATSASYTTGSTTVAGDNGAVFTVDVTNAGGTVTSSPATLTVNAPGSPVITTQPSNQTVTEPATATFTVVATGATSYQWKVNGTPIGGATSASYTTGSTTVAADNGDVYTVDVTNASGTVTSNPATLTVNAVPVTATVTFQEGAASYAGTTDTYLDAFNPGNSYGTVDRVDVNWYDPGTGVSETTLGLLRFDLSSLPAGATITAVSLDLWLIRTNSLSGSDTLVMDKLTGAWTEASTYGGGVPSSTPSGVTAPSLTGVPNGSPLSPSYQYTITGMESLVQGWLDTPASNYGVVFSFASNANFRFASSENAVAAERPKLTVTYTTGGGSAPVITTQPSSVTVTAPATATFTVVATGATSYQWKLNGTPIGGATSASYTTGATTTGMSGNVDTVDVTNASGTTTSNNAVLTVNPGGAAPTITTQPSSATVTEPATATFTVVATGATSYQWQKNSVNIAGATGSSYTTPATTVADNGAAYRVLVTNASGTTTSNNATLTVNAAGGNPITLSVSTATLGAPTGSVTPVTTTITLTNGSGVPVTVTPSSIAPWLTGSTVTVPAGATATLTITGNPAGLTGVNTGVLTLTNSTGGTQTMTVSFTVGTQAGVRKRSCSIGQNASPDSLAWIIGLAALITLTVVVRRREA